MVLVENLTHSFWLFADHITKKCVPPFVDFNRTHCSKLDAAEITRLTKTYENRCFVMMDWQRGCGLYTTIAAQNGPTTPKSGPKLIHIVGSLFWQLGR